ncbi:MAG TPA: hypothetical protein ENH00_13535 [Actinobacteria bacterium]|nr:hypothetical protein BMS3Bbin01_02577 [bacterium BMS3Bbin01]HDH27193.1 hypothetical protein [Actinomycetota bacterium]
MKPGSDKIEAIRANIYPGAHWAINDWEQFPWHHDGKGKPDSDVAHSSQAFCISVWGALCHPDASELRRATARLLKTVPGDVFEERPLLTLEFADRTLLNERPGTPTNIDALLALPDLVIAVESKLTESYGTCSQPGSGHCSGRYEPGSDLKTRTDAPCRLEIQDGTRTPRRYWEVMRRLCRPDTLPVGIDCPFAGPGYQVMRTITTAAELARTRNEDWRAVFALPAHRHPDSIQTVEQMRNLLTADNAKKVAVLDYQLLANQLTDIDPDLARYMQQRLAAA